MSLGNEPIAKTGLTKEEAEGCGDKFYQGITKREYFAGLAMQGMGGHCFSGGMIEVERAALASVAMADALLKELEAES